jgi:hypothetical protein
MTDGPVCPELAEADISIKEPDSRFDPERSLGRQFCCGAQCRTRLGKPTTRLGFSGQSRGLLPTVGARCERA